MKKALISIGVALVCLSTGYALGQAQTPADTDTVFTAKQTPAQKRWGAAARLSDTLADTVAGATAQGVDITETLKKINVGSGTAEGLEPATAVETTYTEAAKDSERTRGVVQQIVSTYYARKASAKSAPQISQITGEAAIQLQLMQVAQNQQIIDQLRQLNKEKPAK